MEAKTRALMPDERFTTQKDHCLPVEALPRADKIQLSKIKGGLGVSQISQRVKVFDLSR
jgi:hypothetical protein